MSSRRDFLKKATLAVAGAALTTSSAKAIESLTMPSFNINRKKKGDGRLHLRFFPYELKLQHVFTVATYSRTTTPDVQVELTYEGITGYGEASMPQYLGQSVESVTRFLSKVNLEQFTDPFRVEDILTYVDSLSPGDSAAKAA
ncbi:MAG: twin-arginine translocation signal domain-containing protein, partial [Prevotella sp.]|nr:twin-arginine translocation signal domain-containing protein [Prevotella sp.]